MRFRYTRYAVAPSPVDRTTAILRPMLQVVVNEIGDETRSVPIAGRLDTGSDVCVLPHAVSETIRPVWRSGVEVLRDYTGGLGRWSPVRASPLVQDGNIDARLAQGTPGQL